MSHYPEHGSEKKRLAAIAEIYRKNGEYEVLAGFYDAIGNRKLRDKYIELVIEADPSDESVCYLRGLQGRPDLIPDEVIKRELSRYTKNKEWNQRASLYCTLGMHREAATDYLRVISDDLKEGNVFAAAYYLKELVEENLIKELFIQALAKAKKENNLWWQVRVFQELGWHDELAKLLVKNAEVIEKSMDVTLCGLLAKAKGDKGKALKFEKMIARGTHTIGSSVVIQNK